MNNLQLLVIEETPKTPYIELNHLTGDFIISGKSIPENAAKVYEPVLLWIQNYVLEARPTTNIRFVIEYFNTASSIWLAKILKVLVRINEPNYVLFIHLYLPIEEFEEMNDMDDIKDAFYPVSDILAGTVISVGLKIYGTGDNNEIIKEKLVFI